MAGLVARKRAAKNDGASAKGLPGNALPADVAPSSERTVGLPELRRLQNLIARLNGCRTLQETLQSIVEGVVQVVGFDVAAVSYLHVDGTFETLAVAGDEGARAALLGQRKPGDAYDREFAVAEQWGPLRFVDHQNLPDGDPAGWVPDVPVKDVPDAWHPLDALYAPLRAPSGELVGMLSVDLPRDRRRPGPFQRELLEMFAAQAGIAVANRRLTEALQASEEAFRLAFERAGAGIALVDVTPTRRGRYLQVNPAMCRIVGRSEAELLTMTFDELTHPDDHATDDEAIVRREAGETGSIVLEKRYLRPDGSTVWVQVISSLVRDADGTPVLAISQVEDISEQRAAREELRRRADHDALTGLPNRRRLTQELARARELSEGSLENSAEPSRTVVLFCDLDRFKQINDVHGHHVGDQVLVEVAARLRRVVRERDLVVRYGGDEFVVVARDLSAIAEQHLLTRLRTALADPVTAAGVSLRVSASIGASSLTGQRGLEAAIREADAAMYRAKVAGRRKPRRHPPVR
jgi:diguanylate cyclase (GGDEF)-like protein/PAS domain S-box-containing protein